MNRDRRPSSPTAPLTSAPAAELPILVGCAGRCGRVMAIRLPPELARDPSLAELRGELHRIGWGLAPANVAASEPAIAIMCDPCLAAAAPGAMRGRVRTLTRGFARA